MNIKIKNIIRGFVKDAAYKFGLKDKVTEIAKQRAKICYDCPFVSANSPKRCTVCGCFIEKKTKVLDEKCPENKW